MWTIYMEKTENRAKSKIENTTQCNEQIKNWAHKTNVQINLTVKEEPHKTRFDFRTQLTTKRTLTERRQYEIQKKKIIRLINNAKCFNR